jgi:hypothetical protein
LSWPARADVTGTGDGGHGRGVPVRRDA